MTTLDRFSPLALVVALVATSSVAEDKVINLEPDSVPKVEEEKPTPSSQVVDFFDGFNKVTLKARQGRCGTAICWGGPNQTRFAIEPLAEVPLGKSFSFGSSGLDGFVNNHNFSVSLAAGVRLWILEDTMSFGLYLSQPIFTGSDRVHVSGLSRDLSTSNIKRPYPGLAIGLFQDIIWLSVDVEELRNGSTEQDRDIAFPLNGVISRAVTVTLAISPLTFARLGLSNLKPDPPSDSGKK